VVLSLTYPNLLGNKMLGCCCGCIDLAELTVCWYSRRKIIIRGQGQDWMLKDIMNQAPGKADEKLNASIGPENPVTNQSLALNGVSTDQVQP
jgi:hypothetical protein